MTLQRVKELKNVFYINLESRPERKKHIEQQLSQLFWGYERFNAIQIHPVTPRNGTLSVAQSHLKVMKQAKERNLDYVIVLEDDFYVEELDLFLESIDYILKNNDDFDVLLLGASCRKKPILKINDHVGKVSESQTATGYLVKKHYFETIIHNFSECCKQLKPTSGAPVDKYWWSLQKKDNWYVVLPICVFQIPSYSDTLMRHVDYRDQMRIYQFL